MTRSPLFPQTQWTALVKACGDPASDQRLRALETLCRDYWYPLYAFARRSGSNPHDAEDLTQGFFHYLLERDLIASANQNLGKLRTFLLTAFQRYIGGVRIRDHAGKRGGGQEIFSLDVAAAERQFGEPGNTLTPQELYDRHWALSVLYGTLEQLRQADEQAGRGGQFEILKGFLDPRSTAEGDYDVATTALGMNLEATRKAVSRLRGKFRDLLRKQIAATLSTPSEELVDAELTALKSAFRG